MDQPAADILDRCLARMQAGASLEECLAEYPQHRADLEAPLLAAAALAGLPRPAMPATTRARLEHMMLAQAAQRRAQQAQPQPTKAAPSPARLFTTAVVAVLHQLGYRGSLSSPWFRLASVAVAAILALIIGSGALAAARVIIAVIVPAATATATPTALPTASSAPTHNFTLAGAIQLFEQELWIVDGTTVVLDSQTAVDGTPTIGAMVEIQGVIQTNGTLLARRIAIATPPTTSVPATALPATEPPVSSPITVPSTPNPWPTVLAEPTPTTVPQPPSPTHAPTSVPVEDEQDDGSEKGTCQGKEKGKEEKKCDRDDDKKKAKDDKKERKRDR